MIRFLLLLLCLCGSISAETQAIDLGRYETSLYSKNGEDGVIAALFQKMGISSRYCVELGASDGITNSNTYLLRLQGWASLLLDRGRENSSLKVHQEFVTKENINRLFKKYQVPLDLDLLVINPKYNAFYFWKDLDQAYRPAVVLTAYNGYLPQDSDSVAIYHPYFCGDGSRCFGASVLALCRLGREKGYTLVYAESQGERLFFVRDDVLASKSLVFKDMGDVQKLYRPAARDLIPSNSEGLQFCSYEEAMKR